MAYITYNNFALSTYIVISGAMLLIYLLWDEMIAKFTRLLVVIDEWQKKKEKYARFSWKFWKLIATASEERELKIS